MNGAGKKLWGWYKTGKYWVPLQVTSAGLVKVDMSAITLGDLADVTGAGAVEGDMLYFDEVSGTFMVGARANLAELFANLVELNDLKDVTIAGLADGHFLAYSEGLGYWQNRLLAEGDLPDLDFLKLTDTPAAYTGQAGKFPKVNAGEDALEFATVEAAATKIVDADGDTKVDVEESADEDKIRMDVKGVEAFLLHDDGILDLAKQSSCRIETDQGISIPNASWTNVTYNLYDYDIQSERDLANNRITVKKDGTYLVIASALINLLPAACAFMIRILLNGVGTGSDKSYAPAGEAPQVTQPLIMYATAGQHFTAQVYQNSGSAVNLVTYRDYNYLAIYKLG